VARTGRAEVLKAAGRLDEAEDTYRETVRRFPGNVIARNGLAEVLKAAGQRADEAGQAGEAGEAGQETAPDAQAGAPGPGAAAPDQASPAAAPAADRPAEDAAGAQAGGDTTAVDDTARDHTAVDDTARDDTAVDDTARDDTAVDDTAARDGTARDDTAVPSARASLRASMRRALVVSEADHRSDLLERVIAETDQTLSRNPHQADALYTKAEALLALGRYAEVERLLGLLPDYLSARPDLQAMLGRLRLARLIAASPQRFDRTVIQSVVAPWERAGRSARALRGVAAVARLRASTAMADGRELDELRTSAVEEVSGMVARDRRPAEAGNDLALASWWMSNVRRTILAGAPADEAPSYESVSPAVEAGLSQLDALDDELVSASRYTYAPR
jgi:hypothetical protein